MIRTTSLAAILLLPIWAWSQTGAATYGPNAYTTVEGCKVFLIPELSGVIVGPTDHLTDTVEIHWTGQCKSDLAEGAGQLSVSYSYTRRFDEKRLLGTTVLTASKGTMRQGRFMDERVSVASRSTSTENGVVDGTPLESTGVLTQKNGIPVQWVSTAKGDSGLITTRSNFDAVGVIKDAFVDLGGGAFSKYTYRDGKLFELVTSFSSGVTTFRPDASGALVAVSDTTPSVTESKSNPTSSSGAGNVVVGMLGAISSGFGAAGGKNAATLKAVGNALQGASGYGGAVPGSSGTGNAGQPNLPPGIHTVPSVNECVGMIRSSFDATLVNNCSFAVHHTYCVVTSGSLLKNMTACQNHQLQSQYIEANGRVSIRPGPFIEMHSVTCKWPAVTARVRFGESESNTTWSGNSFNSPCLENGS